MRPKILTLWVLSAIFLAMNMCGIQAAFASVSGDSSHHDCCKTQPQEHKNCCEKLISNEAVFAKLEISPESRANAVLLAAATDAYCGLEKHGGVSSDPPGDGDDKKPSSKKLSSWSVLSPPVIS